MEITFLDTNVNIKSNIWYSVSGGYYLRDSVLSKIKYFEKQGHKFSHISEINITFLSDLRNRTYDHYLQQPNSL